MPPTMLPTVAMACAWRSLVVFRASARATLAVFCALVIKPASSVAPVRLELKSFWLAASAPSAWSNEVSGVGAVRTLLINDGRFVRELGAVSPAAIDGEVVGSVTGEIVGAVS